MIGKPEWFTYRIFGWGIRPRTWQGWAYVAVGLLLFGLAALLPPPTKEVAWGVLLAVVVIDSLHIMLLLPKVSDERENHHQLLIERNCSFAAVAALVVVALYQSWRNGWLPVRYGLPFDWGITAVFLAMAVAKAASWTYLKARG